MVSIVIFDFHSLKFILQILYNGVSIGSEEQKQLVQSIESFEKCCNQWRDFRNNGNCDCFCDCTGWVRKQISKELYGVILWK